MDFIYARQSADRNGVISVENQIELCMREVAARKHKVFKEAGSGKDTIFKEMMSKIKSGGAKRVIVHGIDKISSSALEFADVVGEFQAHGVEFVSVAEGFSTERPAGKAMLALVMNLAQLERQKTRQRVANTYKSRSRQGFYMGGRVPFGFSLKTTVIDGEKTSMFVTKPDEAKVVKKIFAIYAEPQATLTDVVRYLSKNGIKNPFGKNFSRMRVRDIVINPAYVRADASVYEFFSEHGVEIVSDVSQFTGKNGLYLYTGDGTGKKKEISLEGHVFVPAPHEGFISADTWLRCRRKCLNVRQFAKPSRAKNTWLAGKIKCFDCGYALTLKAYTRKCKENARYFICNSKYSSASCDGVGQVQAEDIEDILLDEIRQKIAGFFPLKQAEVRGGGLKMRVDGIEKEIAALIDRVSSADKATMVYLNDRINALDDEKRMLKEKIIRLTEEPCCMSRWNEVSIDDKVTLLDALIESIRVGHGNVEIVWRI